MYSAMEVAKYIVTKCVNDACPISNLQLQKILYYVQRENLRKTGQPLFENPIEAWQFGPVVPKVYYSFCGFGAMPITSQYKSQETMKQEDKTCINAIVETKRSLNPWDLVEETHKKGGAWDCTYKDGKGNRSIIPNALIKAEG